MKSFVVFKESDRQCMVVELRLQYYWELFLGFIWDLTDVFCCIFKMQYLKSSLIVHFGWFWESVLFKLCNDDHEKCKKNSTVNKLVVKEHVDKIKINYYHRK